MMKLISIFIFGTFLIIGNPIEELKIGKPPTKEQAQKLNHSNEEFEVYLNSENKVEYRDYEYRKVKGTELPFKIIPKEDDRFSFGGRQVNLKIDNGWLVGWLVLIKENGEVIYFGLMKKELSTKRLRVEILRIFLKSMAKSM